MTARSALRRRLASPFRRVLLLASLSSLIVAGGSACRSRSYNAPSGVKADGEDGAFPEPTRLGFKETYRLRRDLALTADLTTSSGWRKVCAPRGELPPAEFDAGGAAPGSEAESGAYFAAARKVGSQVRALSSKQVFVMEKSERPDTFPEKTFGEARAKAEAAGELCIFNRQIPHALLDLNKDAFESNKDEANYEVNFRIDTDGEAGIDFFALFLKEGPDGELRKDSGMNVGLLRKARELAKGMGAKGLTVFGSSVINPKIARVLTKRYDFALVEGDGKRGSTYGRRFDLQAAEEGPGSGGK